MTLLVSDEINGSRGVESNLGEELFNLAEDLYDKRNLAAMEKMQ